MFTQLDLFFKFNYLCIIRPNFGQFWSKVLYLNPERQFKDCRSLETGLTIITLGNVYKT